MKVRRMWLLGFSLVAGTALADSGWEMLSPEHRAWANDLAAQRLGGDVVPIACFTPGYPAKAIAAFESRIWGDAKFRVGARWTSTTLSGTTTIGQPFTLTYSFVPDGTTVARVSGTQQSNLFDFFETECGYTREEWQTLFHDTFDRYEALTGITYVFQATDDGATLPDSGGASGVRGDVRISGISIDGETGSNTLAVNFLPNFGDMVLDTDNVQYYSDRFGNSLPTRNVLAHEHGHGLGLDHTCPINLTKLMEPTINSIFDGPQDDDIQGVQSNYNDRFAGNDSVADAVAIGASTTLQELSVTPGIDDWFVVPVSAGGVLNVTATPVGGAYVEGPQNGDGSCSAGTPLNSLQNGDLALELRNAAGNTVLREARDAAVGAEESLTAAVVTPGDYAVRVVAPATGIVQRYNLTTTFAEQSVPSTDLTASIASVSTGVGPGNTLVYTLVYTNSGSVGVGPVEALLEISASLEGMSWTAAYSGGATGPASGTGVELELASMPAGSSVTLTITTTVSATASSGAIVSAASIMLPADTADPNVNNNRDSLTVPLTSALPNDAEEFDSFTGLPAAGNSPSDTGVGFTASGSFAAGGLELDTTISQNGRGLTYTGTDLSQLALQADLSGGDGYSASSHMVAFWFRVENDPAQANNTWTQLLQARCKGASGPAYLIAVGRDLSGNSRFRVTAPNTNSGGLTITVASTNVPRGQWNQLIVQYTSASDATTNPTTTAQLSVFLNPASDTATQSFGRSGITSQFGAGPLGRYTLGTSFSDAAVGTGGTRVWIDSIGTWDGFGTAGSNDLAAARAFLNDALNDAPTITPASGTFNLVAGADGAPLLLATIADAEDGLLGVTAQLQAAPTGLTITDEELDPATGEFRATIAAACDAAGGPRSLTLTATDRLGGTSESELVISVRANTAPSITVPSNATVDRGDSATFDPPQPPFDAEGTITALTIEPTAIPGGGTASIDAATGAITLVTEAESQPGNVTFTVTGTDNCGVETELPFTAFLGGPDVVARLAVLDGATTLATGSLLDLGETIVGRAALSRTLTIRNDGLIDLTTANFVAPAGYVITDPLAATIPAGQSDELTLTLPSSTIGVAAGDVSFSTNDAAAATFSFTITGEVKPLPFGERWAISAVR